MNDKDQADLGVRRQYTAMGIPLVTFGSSLQILAGNVHEFVPQMIIRGSAILMGIAGIVIMVTGLLKGREARVGKRK